MKEITIAIGLLCITAIIIVALSIGHNGVLAAGATTLIAGGLGWQGTRMADKRGKNIDATKALLRKAGVTDAAIERIISKSKGGE